MRLLIALALSALLIGCASTPPSGTSTPWPTRQAALTALTTWQAEGKIALRNGEAAESANLLWQQRQQQSELQLSGPLGMAATRISSDGHRLTIEQDGNTETMDISTPAAIRLNTGWDLPLTSLPYWMKGLPNPQLSSTATQLEQGRLKTIEQDGWSVTFIDYGDFDGYSLPTRIEVRRADTRARLAIRRWQTDLSPP